MYYIKIGDMGMTEKRFPNIISNVIFVDTGKKPSIEEIKNQMMYQKPLISDEDAFLRHLMRKWNDD